MRWTIWRGWSPAKTVLIHGAAGGVGLAALQIAKLKGAVVFASAGSADKQKAGPDHGRRPCAELALARNSPTTSCG